MIGDHVQAAELAERYDAVVYAVGAQSDRPLGIPGEDLAGSVAAVDFVGWYNAHPHFEEMAPDLSTGRAIVVGNGNVALDVARILVTDPDVLATTDIADHALESLHARGVEEVAHHRPARPAAGHVHHAGAARARRPGGPRRRRRDRRPGRLRRHHRRGPRGRGQDRQEQHQGAARVRRARRRQGAKRRIVFRFRTSPIEIKGDGRVESIVLGRNELVDDETGASSPRTPASARSCPRNWWCAPSAIAACRRPGLPFDDRDGTIPHTDGRIEGSRNEYVVGWIKRGPDRRDRQQQERLAGDRRHPARRSGRGVAGRLRRRPCRSAGGVVAVERQPKLVTDDHWKLIDEHERTSGEPHGRPRVKLTSVAELLRIGHG